MNSFSLLRRPELIPVAVGGLSLTLYILTLAPTVWALDSAELTVGAYTLGIVHAPGYPTYLLIAKLFTLLPIGDVAYRVNLLSAVAAALSAGLVARHLQLWHCRPLVTIAVAWFVAASYFIWASAVIAEVYSVFGAFYLLILLGLRTWRRTMSWRVLGLTALGFGPALGSSPAAALMAPAVILYLVMGRSPRAWVTPGILLPVAGLLLGLLVFLYFPLRGADPTFSYAGLYRTDGTFESLDLQSPQGIWAMIRGESFSGLFFANPGTRWTTEAGQTVAWIAGNVFGVGVPLALFGLIVSFRLNRADAWLFLLVWLPHIIFFTTYGAIDKQTMFVPSHLVWGIWMGIGLERFLGRLRQNWGRGMERAAAGLALILPIAAVLVNYGLVDLRFDFSAAERAQTVLDQVEPNAAVISYWDLAPVLEYYRIVEGRRPDVLSVNMFFVLPERFDPLIDHLAAERPVYVTGEHLIPSNRYAGRPEGELYRLVPLRGPRRP